MRSKSNAFVNCTENLVELENRFLFDWKAERAHQLGTLGQLTIKNADLRRANLGSAVLTGVRFVDSTLKSAWLWNANLEQIYAVRVDFSRATFRSSHGEFGTCIRCAFANAELTYLDFFGFQFDELGDSNLTGARMLHSDLRYTSFPTDQGFWFIGNSLEENSNFLGSSFDNNFRQYNPSIVGTFRK